MRRILLLSLLTATVVLAGCPKRNQVKEPPPAPEASAESGSLENNGLQEGQALEGSQTNQAGALGQLVIYFDFDSSEVRADSREIIDAHARNLAARSTLKVRLEGHTDERGSREYNIGLGERRAQAVRRALMLQGAGDAQIATVSYGEERPAVAGADESAWGKNRRVEIVYVN